VAGFVHDGNPTDNWGDFFVSTAGAAAVLTGLIFVAVTVNIRPALDAGSG
jgi:hypothetical protein